MAIQVKKQRCAAASMWAVFNGTDAYWTINVGVCVAVGVSCPSPIRDTGGPASPLDRPAIVPNFAP